MRTWVGHGGISERKPQACSDEAGSAPRHQPRQHLLRSGAGVSAADFALLRRLDDVRTTTLRIGSLELDLVERTVRRSGRPIDLLPREFKLLEYFARRPDQVVTRAMLLEDVWHYTFTPQTNVVDVHISNLRRKIDAKGEPPLITNIRGVGFMLHADA